MDDERLEVLSDETLSNQSKLSQKHCQVAHGEIPDKAVYFPFSLIKEPAIPGSGDGGQVILEISLGGVM